MKRYRVREKSLAWHIVRAKKPLRIIGILLAILVMFMALSVTAADDYETYTLAYATDGQYWGDTV